MIYQGVIITNASGKIGGSVWSHNRGGPYVRTNTFPTGGPSSEQTVMRQAMTDTNQGWRDLSAVNRARCCRPMARASSSRAAPVRSA